MAPKDAGGGGSRLDRLLRLLDTGSTPGAKQSAATQIGELAALHPTQLPNLLRRIRGFLKSKQWETRVAAARTVSCICEGISHATVADIARLEGVSLEAALAAAAAPLPGSSSAVATASADASTDLTFDGFDIEGVLERAAPLLSAKVGDFNAGAVDDTHSNLSKAERLRRAKQSLRQRLGLALEEDGGTEGGGGGAGGNGGGSAGGSGGGGGGSGGGGGALDVGKFIDVDDLVGEDDVEDDVEVKVKEEEGGVVKVEEAEAPAKVDATEIGQLSAREKNRLKRKIKRGGGGGGNGGGGGGDDAPSAKRMKGGELFGEVDAAAAEAAEEEEEAAEVDAGGWPLARTCEALAYSLFAAGWEAGAYTRPLVGST
jgi:TATA-binding protein-associated factor